VLRRPGEEDEVHSTGYQGMLSMVKQIRIDTDEFQGHLYQLPEKE